MPKNIVLCCDGTSNQFSRNNTNVVKLFFALDQHAQDQVVYYHPGLGTMEPPGALTHFARKFTKLAGLAFGYGLEADIRDAYIFLMNNFEDGDRVFLFGFSRGAYTVRCVAALVRMYGLIPRDNDAFVLYAIRMLLAIHKIQTRGGPKSAAEKNYFKLANDFKQTFSSRDCRPWFVGVWDTVSSVGWYNNPLKLPYTSDNPDIEIGRHAVAIDERRAFFRSNLWHLRSDPPESGPKNLKQVWFPGEHCDVGGGHPEQESGLSKLALEWMLKEAIEAGLLVDKARMATILGQTDNQYARPDANAIMHTSLKGVWWLAEFVFKPHYDWKRRETRRRMNLGRRRTIPAGSLIHVSAYQRGEAYQKLLPPNGIPTS